MKTCTECGIAKVETDFSKYKAGKPGLRSTCKACVSAYNKIRFPKDKERIKAYNKKHRNKYRERHTERARRYRENNRDKVTAYLKAYHYKNRHKARAYELLRKYNITIDEYAILSDKQGGLCAICKKPETRKQKGVLLPLVVDHCHKANCIRGLLCSRCNVMIGMANDDTRCLLAGIDYLNSMKLKV